MRFRSVKLTENLYYSSPDGLIKLCFCIEDDTIIQVRFTDGIESNVHEGELYSAIKTQFDDYFAGNLQEFDLPLFATGTVFQLLVWEALMKIPYGTTQSYKDLAEQIGKPDSARAVGRALSENPVPILVPCHRVVSADGSLGGFLGGLTAKRYLLRLEAEGIKS